jgi:7-cyano-7-deazaguanine reductase
MERRLTIETFANPHPLRQYLIEHVVHEFTSLCPKTGQPDFAVIRIRYVAAASCIELRSLKTYLQSFRNDGIFYEDVTNLVLDDLVAVSAPRWMQIETTWTVRGGIHSIISAEHGKRD